MKQRKRRAKVRARFKLSDYNKEVKETALQRQKRKSNELMDARILELRQERILVKTLVKIKDANPEVGAYKLASFYDIFFRLIEPNYVKRKARLLKLFNLRPSTSDREWVSIIYSSHKLIKKISHSQYLKHQSLCKRKSN